MKSYNEFAKDWKKENVEKGKKYSKKKLSNAWKKYKEFSKRLKKHHSKEKKPDKVIEEKKPIFKEMPENFVEIKTINAIPDKKLREKLDATSPAISVEVQKSEITNLKEVPEASNISQSISAGEALPSPVPLEQQPIESYLHLATAVHLTAQNIIKFIVPSVNITDDSMKRLNNSGALLIQKYDRTGAMQKFGHEMAYILTLLDISTQVYVVYAQEQKKKEESEDLEKTEDDTPTKPSEAKANFFKDTTSRGQGAKN